MSSWADSVGSPYRTPHRGTIDPEELWARLDEALLLWCSDPDGALRLGRWVWQDARRFQLRDIEAAADGFLASLAAGPWF